jgi:hypothetical protein
MRLAVDYGCGKLRYSGFLAARARRVILVDSSTQLDRTQPLGSDRTSVRAFAKSHWSHASVLTPEEFAGTNIRADFILCAHVLSAIPIRNARATVVINVARHLSQTGRALFVTQFRDTYFTRMLQSRKTIKHLDGWIQVNKQGAFFFGVIGVDELSHVVGAGGLRVTRAWTHEKCAYVEAKGSRPMAIQSHTRSRDANRLTRSR